MIESYSVTITEVVNNKLIKHLVRDDLQEDLCFGLYLPSRGSRRFTGIIQDIILPEDGDRRVHGNASFNPEYLVRSLRIAKEKSMGLVFLHSHPANGWQGMSGPDIKAEKRISKSAFGVTDLPLLGMTLGLDGSWSARFWPKDQKKKRTHLREWCKSVKVVNEGLSFTFYEHMYPDHIDNQSQLRTISAWGKENQIMLSRINVGVVGLGSVGSQVGESLARTGFANVTFIDFDSVEKKNLDRLSNVYKTSIGTAKVDAVAEGYFKSATSINHTISKSEYSICEEKGYREALNCDILISCVDRPWAREVLNFIAYCHLIPVIDGGIKVRTNSDNTKMISADWKVQTVGYKKPCLECLGQYKAEFASLEQEGLLDDPEYIQGMEDKTDLLSKENVYAFSSHVASLQILQLIGLIIRPSGIAYQGQQTHHMVLGTTEVNKNLSCNDYCFFKENLGKADSTGVIPYGEHQVAEMERQKREVQEIDAPQADNIFYRLWKKVKSFFMNTIVSYED